MHRPSRAPRASLASAQRGASRGDSGADGRKRASAARSPISALARSATAASGRSPTRIVTPRARAAQRGERRNWQGRAARDSVSAEDTDADERGEDQAEHGHGASPSSPTARSSASLTSPIPSASGHASATPRRTAPDSSPRGEFVEWRPVGHEGAATMVGARCPSGSSPCRRYSCEDPSSWSAHAKARPRRREYDDRQGRRDLASRSASSRRGLSLRPYGAGRSAARADRSSPREPMAPRHYRRCVAARCWAQPVARLERTSLARRRPVVAERPWRSLRAAQC
jgi:hypothetical protein